ncbi:MAG: DUF2807 domain-containing protein [Bacteroides sp.]|nr:DUF2807 domain-containing protein [Bacteroides sp.]MCM1086287.1 DUF2807 domain-containing protein [Bacteroides sp.]MCM1169385.1 DUF2807 domain-containing protein [Bacteroides sp.]
MKKILVKALFLALTGVLPVSAAWSQEEEHDHRISHKIELTDVRVLEIEGMFNVVLSQGLNESVEIDAPCEVLDKISAKQSGKSFKMSVKDKVAQQYKVIFVKVTLKDPQQIILKGAPKVRMFDVLACNRLALQLSGSATFHGDVRAAEHIDLKMDGHTTLNSSFTAVKASKVELSDYAVAEVIGYAPALTLVQSGNSRFGHKEYRTDKLDARLSGVARAGLTVNKSLSATVGDAAVLNYSGMPKTDISLSGVAKVEKF